MADNNADRPRFGPPCSPAIFASKWLEKFDHNGVAMRDDPANIERPILAAVELILEFTREAHSLQLRQTSYAADAPNICPAYYQNPFSAAKLTWTFINVMVEEYNWAPVLGVPLTAAQQAVRDRVTELVAAGRWEQQIPERWRREIIRWGWGEDS